MKQIMKRKIQREECTDEVDFEISYQGDNSLGERIDAVLASIDCAIDDADSRRGSA
jgi:hypothetical protein